MCTRAVLIGYVGRGEGGALWPGRGCWGCERQRLGQTKRVGQTTGRNAMMAYIDDSIPRQPLLTRQLFRPAGAGTAALMQFHHYPSAHARIFGCSGICVGRIARSWGTVVPASGRERNRRDGQPSQPPGWLAAFHYCWRRFLPPGRQGSGGHMCPPSASPPLDKPLAAPVGFADDLADPRRSRKTRMFRLPVPAVRAAVRIPQQVRPSTRDHRFSPRCTFTSADTCPQKAGK